MPANTALQIKGLQVPRYGIDPPDISNCHDADDAIEFFNRYSVQLDEWQELVLRSWLSRRADGKWAASKAGLSIARQQGKSLLLEVRCIFGMIFLKEKIIFTAHELRTARAVFNRICEFFEDDSHPEITKLVKVIRKANGLD